MIPPLTQPATGGRSLVLGTLCVAGACTLAAAVAVWSLREEATAPPLGVGQPDGAPPPVGEVEAAEDEAPTGARLLADLLAADIPPVADLQILTDLDQARQRAREFVCPVVHVLVRGAEDPAWLDLQERLDGSKLTRSILASCVLVVTAQPDLPVSPTITVHSTEVVTPAQGHYEASHDESGVDGGVVFVVHPRPGGGGFEAPAAPPARSRIPGAVGAVTTPEGAPLLRHRIVELFAGVPEIEQLGRRVWAVIRNEYRVDRLRLDLREGRVREEGLRELLGDDTSSLLTPDERIQALTRFLRGAPQDLWAVHRACQVMFGDTVADPGELLACARAAWADADTPQRELLESQVELTLYGNREKAIVLLRRALERAPESPELWERLARCAVVGAGRADDATRAKELRALAVDAVTELRRVDPGHPTLWLLERALTRALAEATRDH